MVLVQTHPACADDVGPLALLRARRAEAEAALPRSMAMSSLTMLTLVVGFMFVQIVLRGGVAVFENNPAPTDSRFPPAFDPAPGYFAIPGAVGPVVTTSGVATVIPVDDAAEAKDQPLVSPAQSTETLALPGDGPTVGNGNRSSGTGSLSGVGDPDPKEYIFRDEEPQVVSRVQPEYPRIALAAGMEGQVTLRLLVGLDGHVRRAEVVDSAPLFDEAAVTAARQWTFTPAKANGHPVKVWISLPVRFVIR